MSEICPPQTRYYTDEKKTKNQIKIVRKRTREKIASNKCVRLYIKIKYGFSEAFL
jgi:hypothetical protein